jgi:hypothetical protein
MVEKCQLSKGGTIGGLWGQSILGDLICYSLARFLAGGATPIALKLKVHECCGYDYSSQDEI